MLRLRRDLPTKLWIGYALVVIGLLFYVELAAPVPYPIKVGLKICLMLAPVLFIDANFFRAPQWNRFRIALSLGLISFVVIQLTYVVLQKVIDLQQISTLLLKQQGITAPAFIGVAIYITFGNSLLEEWFFRGFLTHLPLRRPWLFSSCLFALYHLTIFINWFSWWVALIALVGLFVGGLLFCWLNAGERSIWNSWAMHIGADISIVIIGLQMFGYF